MPRLRRGYTLVEFLLYIAITAILAAFATDIVLNALQGKSKLEAVNEVTQNSREAMERLELAIRNAADVTTPAAGATSTQLVLQMDAAPLNPTTFSLASGALLMKEDAYATTTLTESGVVIQSLLFRNLGAVGAPGTIRIEMSVSSTNLNADPDYSSGQTIYGSAAVRKRL